MATCQVMISYQACDAGPTALGGDGSAAQLRDGLLAAGYSVFSDSADMEGMHLQGGGQKAIQAAVEGCLAFLAVCSTAYATEARSNTTLELLLAQRRNKLIVPVYHSGHWPPTAAATEHLGFAPGRCVTSPPLCADGAACAEVVTQLLATLQRLGVPPAAAPLPVPIATVCSAAMHVPRTLPSASAHAPQAAPPPPPPPHSTSGAAAARISELEARVSELEAERGEASVRLELAEERAAAAEAELRMLKVVVEVWSDDVAEEPVEDDCPAAFRFAFKWFDALGFDRLIFRQSSVPGTHINLFAEMTPIVAAWWASRSAAFPGVRLWPTNRGLKSDGDTSEERVLVAKGDVQADVLAAVKCVVEHVWGHVLPSQLNVVMLPVSPFADIGRIVRAVMALPERSVDPLTWSFNANCTSYQAWTYDPVAKRGGGGRPVMCVTGRPGEGVLRVVQATVAANSGGGGGGWGCGGGAGRGAGRGGSYRGGGRSGGGQP